MKTRGRKHQLEALKRMAQHKHFALLMDMGTGKAVPTDTKVMTPEGWRRIGELKVGDKLFAGNGSVTSVEGVFPQGELEVFELEMNDGTKVRCCDDHLWKVASNASRIAVRKGKRRDPYDILPLKAFRNHIKHKNGNNNFSIPLNGILQFESVQTTIPAYTMGVLLGDGCLRGRATAFTSADPEIVETVRRFLPSDLRITSRGINHDIVGGAVYKDEIERLGLRGTYSYTKFIPDLYKFSDSETRFQVLRGLMDTDGTVENGCAVYGSSSERMAKDVADIVRSLGGIARIKHRTSRGYTKGNKRFAARDGWSVRINLPDINPFFLARKARIYRPNKKYTPRHKFIKSVSRWGKAECVCIAVKDASKLFIIEGHNVTHNTWVFMAHAERLYSAGKIDGLLVLAPKGVHTNWIRREIPRHMSVKHVARAWRTGAGKRELAHIEEVLKPREDGETPPLRILAMNIDAIANAKGFDLAERFLNCTNGMIVLDESTRIKSEKSERAKAAMELRTLVEYRYIGTGLLTPQGPSDAFSQFEFLEPGSLGTTSFRAFNAEYSQLMDANHPMLKRMIQKNPRMAWAQIVEKDEITGRPIYRNLDKLQKLMDPISFRVLKSQCLDLPEKVFKQVYFDLMPAQFNAYKLMEKKYRFELENGELETFAKLNTVAKLQQITSGFVILKDGSLEYVAKNNPRLDALEEMLEDRAGEKVIIWAHFREEIRAIAELMRKMKRRAVEYHGGIKEGSKEGQRDWAVDEFQERGADTFIGQQGSGGIGLTLTAAKQVIYYSNNYNLEQRKQSEDRAHRDGLKHTVVYTDIVAENTVDETIAEALQEKSAVAAMILKDPSCLWRKPQAA